MFFFGPVGHKKLRKKSKFWTAVIKFADYGNNQTAMASAMCTSTVYHGVHASAK